jgi:arsenite-transporting ATPase
VVNGLFRARPHDRSPSPWSARGEEALAAMPTASRAAAHELPLLPFGLVGVPALRALFGRADGSLDAVVRSAASRGAAPALPSSTRSCRARSGGHGVIMTMGKGGVGKTTWP